MGQMKIFHVGSHQFRELLRELLRELWFSHCSSRAMPFREWSFVFREWNFEFRELLREYPGTLPELREWPFHSESVFPEIGVVPRLLKVPPRASLLFFSPSPRKLTTTHFPAVSLSPWYFTTALSHHACWCQFPRKNREQAPDFHYLVNLLVLRKSTGEVGVRNWRLIFNWGKVLYLQLEVFYLQLRFCAYSPLRCFLDTLSHCKQRSSIISKKARAVS